jgi:hypothetical protein
MADQKLTFKEGDTDPPITHVLEEFDQEAEEWVPMPLTGKTVRLLAQETRSKKRIGGVASVDLVTSEVSWAPGLTDLTVGEWRYEWEVTTPDGSRRTIPQGGYYEFTVMPKSGVITP